MYSKSRNTGKKELNVSGIAKAETSGNQITKKLQVCLISTNDSKKLNAGLFLTGGGTSLTS